MPKKIGLLRGDGIGPEISSAVCSIIDALKLPIEWEDIPCGDISIKANGNPLTDTAIRRVKELGVALKGPMTTPIGTGFRSVNVALRKSLDLFVNLRPVFNLPGIQTSFNNIDLVIVRENTEDLYSGVEKKISDDEAHSIKIITRPGSERISKFAFEFAREHKRKKVTCVHKANIMKLTDGLFLDSFRKIAQSYKDIEAQDVIVDNMCMQLVMKPQQYDVIVTENLYGDILSDLCAGLIGGLGVAGGANIGKDSAVFEAVHGTAPDIAGKNMANPTALLLSGLMMLDHLNFKEANQKLKKALIEVYSEGKTLTRDLKGSASTQEFTRAVISKL